MLYTLSVCIDSLLTAYASDVKPLIDYAVRQPSWHPEWHMFAEQHDASKSLSGTLFSTDMCMAQDGRACHAMTTGCKSVQRRLVIYVSICHVPLHLHYLLYDTS